MLRNLRTLPPYSESCDLDMSVSVIKEQLSKCHEEHPAWQNSETPLPTRAVYIGSSNSEVRLVEAKGTTAKYVTLSHCWGGEQPTKTTIYNLAALTDCLDFETLPIVFQQTILLARKLGVDYVWIDSLCIIQDSVSDWELESAQMCDYYENAYLTISTATSPSPNIPFLATRDTKWTPIEVQLATKQGNETLMAQRVAITPEEQGKLFTRGWAWQESAMSSQMVYFTPSELIWECSKCHDHVVPQRYIPDKRSSDRLGFSQILSTLRFGFASGRSRFAEQISYPDDHWDGAYSYSESAEPDARDFDYIWDEWNDLVVYYSRRELTFLLDRLPALSGVAYRVYEATKSQYLAGIWEDSLPTSLCWVTEHNRDEALPLPQQYVVPSWSWASVVREIEAQVERSIEQFESAVTILEAKCYVPGLNPFGRVSDGYIRLRGQISEATLTCDNPHSGAHYVISGQEENIWFRPDSALVEQDGSVFRAREGQTLADFTSTVSCMYLGSSIPYRSLEGDKTTHYMMVLSAGDEDGSYCRIGLLTLVADFSFELDESMCREIKIV